MRASCFGRLSVFVPKDGAAETCAECQLAETCPDYRKSKPGRAALCVYNSEKDVDDTDTLIIDYESGALATYVECFYSPTVERRFSIVGDEGELVASEERGMIEYRRLREKAWTHIDIDYNPGGHRGADPLMVTAAIEYFRGDVGEEAKVGSEAGRMSVLIALAAQRSAKEGRIVTIEEMVADESAGAFGDETHDSGYDSPAGERRGRGTY